MTEKSAFSSAGRIMYLIAWLMIFFLFFIFFYHFKNSTPPEFTVRGGTLTIPADDSGHFRLKGSINGKAVTFIIDTGATLVGLSKDTADNLQLKELYPITLQTAAGETTGSLTRLENITFGNFSMNNVKAVIMPGSQHDEVLLGMNVLSRFVIVQENKQLMIKPKND